MSDLETTFAPKILFLKHYSQVWFTTFRADAARTGKPVRGTLSTSVKDQMVACDYKVVHQNFKFFGKESNRYLLNLIEILSIKRGKPSLYKSLYCKSFYCFEYSI